MTGQDLVYVSLAPEAEAFLIDNGIGLAELLGEAKVDAQVIQGVDPAIAGSGRKDPATIILASAAAVALATPLLRELIRNLSGRTPLIRERQLIQANDSEGAPAYDSQGNPIMEWRLIERDNVGGDKISVKGFGIEISFETG